MPTALSCQPEACTQLEAGLTRRENKREGYRFDYSVEHGVILCQRRNAELTLVDRTRAQVRQALLSGEPVLEIIAEKMGLSAGSLQRRLREQGATFTALVDKVRCELATHYLQQRHLPIAELALLLGYSYVSAFSRAFRRWFGISPRQWRQLPA
ncbi:helix-turn-helix transcriptional regulator [Serratia plymuthica]|nr:helix-turn-helix transcriptional regulator [Serratia plymuthica]